MNIRLFERTIIVIMAICLLVMCVSCASDNSQYGYRESGIARQSLRSVFETVDDMYSSILTDTVLVVYTRTPLDERTLQSEDQGNGIYKHYTLTDCIILEVIKNITGRDIAKGDQIALGERWYLKNAETDKGYETILFRPEPYFYPIDVGHPYLVFCTSNDGFGNGYVYWAQPYGYFDISNIKPTDSEIDAMTANKDELYVIDYADALKNFTQRKESVSGKSDFLSYFAKYENVSLS